MDKLVVMKELFDTYYKHSEPDWDSFGASPVTIPNYIAAVTLLNSLPEEMPQPKIWVNCDNQFCFYWGSRDKDLFSISITSSLEIDCVGTCNGTTFSGNSTLNAPEFLEYVRIMVHKITSKE